jgi:hypothetical protein
MQERQRERQRETVRERQRERDRERDRERERVLAHTHGTVNQVATSYSNVGKSPHPLGWVEILQWVLRD